MTNYIWNQCFTTLKGCSGPGWLAKMNHISTQPFTTKTLVLFALTVNVLCTSQFQIRDTVLDPAQPSLSNHNNNSVSSGYINAVTPVCGSA